MSKLPIIIERTYPAPIKKIWRALTDHKQMKQWYFDLPDFKAEKGFEFTFEGGKEGRTYVHLCKITEVIEGKKLVHSWRYEGYEGDSLVTFELSEEGSSTRLQLTHKGLETFPKNNPDFARENFVEGWSFITGTSLMTYLENK